MTTFPTVNNNGSSGKELQSEQHAVYCAAYDLRTALRQNKPHGRDYANSRIGDLQRARSEHDALMIMVKAIMERALEISANLQEQIDGN